MQKEPTKKAAATQVVIGPYRIPIQREVFIAWEAELMTIAGFTNKDIRIEILRRLGICTK